MRLYNDCVISADTRHELKATVTRRKYYLDSPNTQKGLKIPLPQKYCRKKETAMTMNAMEVLKMHHKQIWLKIGFRGGFFEDGNKPSGSTKDGGFL